ncbi:MAG: iron-sulfur cluster assembly scaffold protein [bacterium]|nr:iron-sulfur cluster assembly scaffold protein [bacterium]
MDNQKVKEKKPIPEGGLAAGDVVNQFTGERWYYSDIVKEHFFNPRNLMLEEPDENAYDATGMVGSPACLAPETLVLTGAGLKEIPNIQVGEKVLSHDSGYYPVEKAFRVRYQAGSLIKIKNFQGEIIATPDHLIYAKQYMSESNAYAPITWAHAGDLKAKDICLYPVVGERHHIELPIEHVETMSFEGGRLYNFEVADSHTYATSAFLVHNCGDMMKMWLKIEPQTEKVAEMKWRTFGCGSAIAATSMFSVMVTENGGLPLGEALKIKPQHIMDRLGGLPNRKIHCSVLADKAFRKAANDYFRRTNQNERVMIEGAKVIDVKLNITDKDIEEAVLEGAVDLETVQKKLKVGVGSPEIITEVEQLIRFYKEKYYG